MTDECGYTVVKCVSNEPKPKYHPMSHALHANLSRFYFIYYFFVGAFVPYWGLYLQSEHFSAADIGILMSLFQISRIFAPNLWGWLADYTKQRVKWIQLTAINTSRPSKAVSCIHLTRSLV